MNFLEIEEMKDEVRKNAMIPLGYIGVENYVFSKYRNTIITMGNGDFSKSAVINMFGIDFLKSFEKKVGDKEILDLTDVQTYICDSCIKKGIYNVENIKGFGIFRDELNEDELIVNTTKIWGTSENFKNERVWGKTVFNDEKNLYLSKDQDLPTNSDIKKLYEILNGWNWNRGDQDIKMVTGWILCATLAGAVNWRTHASLTGSRGTGKSTFLEYFLKRILGQFAMLADGGSSEAGIRQNVGNSSCAVLLDESESDGKRLSSILTMLRSSSSGSTLLRGTADQKAKNYSLKIAGFLAGIVPPDLNAADSSRFLTLELKQARKGQREPFEIYDEKFMQNLGLKLVAFIVKYFKQFLQNKEKVVKIMMQNGADGRYCETNAPLVASSFMLYNLFHNESSENDIFDNQNCYLKDFDEVEFTKFISNFDFKKEIDNNNKKDEEELLNFIFSAKLSSETIRQDCVSNHLLAAIGLYDYNEEEKGYKVNKKDVKKLLGLSGIAVKEELGLNYVYIDTTDFNFRKLIKETKFEKGNLVAVLKRHKHSVEIEEEKTHVSINNSKRAKGKVVKILFDLNEFNTDEELNKKMEKEIKEEKKKNEIDFDSIEYTQNEKLPEIDLSTNEEELTF